MSLSQLFPTANKDYTYDAYEKDIASVHFYFEKTTVLQFHRQNRITPLEIASQVGGLLGLCLGFSIASGVEIVYWMFFRLCCRMKREPAEVADDSASR